MALVSQAEFARRQGVSRAYVTKLVKKGIIKLVNKKVDTEQALNSLQINSDPATLLRSDKQDDSQPGKQQGAVDFVAARTMREAFRAKLAKLEFEEKSGKLTDASKVQNDAFKAGRIIRDELISIPDRLADVLAAEVDPRQVRQILMEELELTLNRLCKQQ